MVESRNRTRAIIHDALRAQRYAVVATEADGQPHANLMAFAPVAAGRELVLAMYRGTRKYDNVVANPHVAVLIDHQERNGLRSPRRLGVTAKGSAAPIEGAEIVGARAAFLARHPDLAGLARASECVFVRVTVAWYQVAAGIDDVGWCRASALVGDPEPVP